MEESHSEQINISNLPERSLHIYSKLNFFLCTIAIPIISVFNLSILWDMYLEHQSVFNLLNLVCFTIIIPVIAIHPFFFKITVSNTGINIQRWRRKEIHWDNVAEVSGIINIQNESRLLLKMKDNKYYSIKGNRKTFQPIFEGIKQELDRVIFPDKITDMPVFHHNQLSKPIFILLIFVSISPLILTPFTFDFITGKTENPLGMFLSIFISVILFNLIVHRIDNNSIRFIHSQKWKKPRYAKVYWKDVIKILSINEMKKYGLKIYSLEYSTNEGTFKAYSLNPKTYELFFKMKDAFLVRSVTGCINESS